MTTVTCDGSNDTARLQKALETEAPSGVVVVRAGGECVVEHDLRIAGSTRLSGEPHAVLVARSSAGFDRGVVSCAGGDAAPTLSGLRVDVGGSGVAAFVCGDVADPGVRFEGVDVAAATAASGDAALVDVACPASRRRCARLLDVSVSCGARGDGQRPGIAIQGPKGGDASAILARVDVRDCPVGVRARDARVVVRDSFVSSFGRAAVGVDLPDRAMLADTEVRVKAPEGGSAIGVRTGRSGRVMANRVRVGGGDVVAIHGGGSSHVVDNEIKLGDGVGGVGIDVGSASSVRGNEITTRRRPGVVAATLRGGYSVYGMNRSSLSEGRDSTHVLVLSDQNLVESNSFASGDWGVRPPAFEAAGSRGFNNGARLVGNNMVFQAKGCAILQTGWHAQANTCNWLKADGAGFWIGSPGPNGDCTGHTLVSGNTLHSAQLSASLVRFAPATRRCHGPEQGRPESLRDCSRDGMCPEGERCRRVVCTGIGITDNLMMGMSRVPIDVSFQGADPGGGPRLEGLFVSGNTLQLQNATALVGFNPLQPPGLIRGVRIEGNGPMPLQAAEGWKEPFGQPPAARRTRLRRPQHPSP